MKFLTFLPMLALWGIFFVSLPAAAQSNAYDKAVYEKARYQVFCKLSDDDFVAYCITMNFGEDVIPKLHNEILATANDLQELRKQGFAEDNPQVEALKVALNKLVTKLGVKISEARKGEEIEAKIADLTLTALSQTQR